MQYCTFYEPSNLVGHRHREMEYRPREDRQHVCWAEVTAADSLQAQRSPLYATFEITSIGKTLSKSDFVLYSAPHLWCLGGSSKILVMEYIQDADFQQLVQ